LNKLYFGDNLDSLCEHPQWRNALMVGTERARIPDLTLGRSTFKRTAVEDMGAEQGRLFSVAGKNLAKKVIHKRN
jgi:hypothetical protein